LGSFCHAIPLPAFFDGSIGYFSDIVKFLRKEFDMNVRKQCMVPGLALAHGRKLADTLHDAM
jgi:hypothetical protein